MKGIPQQVFPTVFPPVLQLLPPSMLLLTKYWAGHHLPFLKLCLKPFTYDWDSNPRGRDSVLSLATQSYPTGT